MNLLINWKLILLGIRIWIVVVWLNGFIKKKKTVALMGHTHRHRHTRLTLMVARMWRKKRKNEKTEYKINDASYFRGSVLFSRGDDKTPALIILTAIHNEHIAHTLQYPKSVVISTSSCVCFYLPFGALFALSTLPYYFCVDWVDSSTPTITHTQSQCAFAHFTKWTEKNSFNINKYDLYQISRI